jgi:serine/threonine-protein phosphatase 2A regulatory subunit B'
MSVYGNRKVPLQPSGTNSDDESDDDPGGEIVFATQGDQADPIDLPKPAYGEDVFRSVTCIEEIQRLPPIVRERDKGKRQASFIPKIEQCNVVFDFTEQANPTDYAAFATSKQVKKNALNELINYVANNKDVLNAETLSGVVAMVGKNLFRTFANHKDPRAAPYDPEDDEPILEPAWPHLHLVYTFFLRCLESKSVTSELYAKTVDGHYIRQFMELCGSCDPRERDVAKSCIHRMYGRFMPIRASIRKYMQVIFARHSNGLFHEHFYGVGEILEFYGCIVSGFVSPLKQEHQDMLCKALLPLHRKKQLSGYHRQLVHIISQFLTKEMSLGPTVLAYLYRYWPKGHSQKQVLFLNEMQSLSQALGTSFPPLFVDFCKKIAACIESVHFMVSERALAYFHLSSFVKLATAQAEDVFPILAPAIYRNSKRHWSGAIHDHNEHAVSVMNQIDADLYMQFSGGPVAAHDKDVDIARIDIEDKWAQIAALARQNPLSKTIGVVEMPKAPAYTPDIFMKGETTSPKRQVRQHRRQSVVALAPMRNQADVKAIKAAEHMDSDDDDDDDDSSSSLSSMVAPVRNKPGLIRQKSVVVLPNAANTAKELDTHDYDADLADVEPTPPNSPNSRDAEYANTHDAPPPRPPPQESPPPQSSEEDEWIPLDVEPSCTDGCWMVKRKSGMFKRSRRRWFVIERDAFRVAYYIAGPGKPDGPDSGPAKGFIMFSDILELGTDRRQLFLVTASRRFALTSDTSLITNQWAQALGGALQNHDAQERIIGEEEEPEIKFGAGSENGSPPSSGADYGGFGFEFPPSSPGTSDDAPPDDLRSPRGSSSDLTREKSISGLQRSLSVESKEDGRLANAGGDTDWFAGRISKADCEAAVSGANEGDFLVREMKVGGKYVVCVNDAGQPANYTIKKDPTNDNMYKYGSEFKDDIEGIIDLMRVQPPSNKTGKRLWLMEAAPLQNSTPPSPIVRDRKGSVYGFGDENDLHGGELEL